MHYLLSSPNRQLPRPLTKRKYGSTVPRPKPIIHNTLQIIFCRSASAILAPTALSVADTSSAFAKDS